MSSPTGGPKSRVYALLLRLFPRSFRDEYGGEMEALFARRRRDADGFAPRIGLWLETLVDTLTAAVRCHADLLRQDVLQALRTFRRAPGFTGAVLLVSALGIGAMTAAFSITDHVLLRPLPYAGWERLVAVWQSNGNYARTEPSPAVFHDWQQLNTSFESLGAWYSGAINLVGVGEPVRLESTALTPNLMDMLGVRPRLGRSFSQEDARPGAPQTLLLSHAVWQSRFAGDPSILGRAVRIDGAPATVIGVMAPDFSFPKRGMQAWRPLGFGEEDYKERDNNYLKVVGKLRPGVTIEAVRTEMGVISERLAKAYPPAPGATKAGSTLFPLRSDVPWRSRQLLMALVGAALCLLLIACANLASLLLARALVRRKEISVRTALGAGKGRLVRQLLTESALLALGGGVLGVAAGFASMPLLALLVPPSLPITELPRLDLRVLSVAAVVTMFTALAFGVLPALRACRGTGPADLREGGRSGVGGRRERLRGFLVGAEVTISVVLLISAGLLLRALSRIQDTDPGFKSAGVLTLRTALPSPEYDATLRRAQFYDRVLAQTRQLPGVTGAAYISSLPIAYGGGIWSVEVPGRPRDDSNQRASLRFVTPGYFATMNTPLRAGRDTDPSDTFEAPFVAVVSESFAKQYWPGKDPLGQHFKFAFMPRTVVGVVGDIRIRGLERESEPQVYVPYRQVADNSVSWYSPKDLVVRSAANPLDLMPALRDIVRAADPNQPISDIRLLADIVADDTAPRRVQVIVLGAFAAIACLLAGVGLHGLLSFGVATRSQEFAVRMAIGAERMDIIRLVAREGATLAAAGIGIGLVLAYAAGRSLQALLVGLNPGDLTTYAAALALVLAGTALGTFLPAWRAVRVSPAAALRAE
ncbi:MAG: ABC transporter permease [Acidobacteriota bacterium]